MCCGINSEKVILKQITEMGNNFKRFQFQDCEEFILYWVGVNVKNVLTITWFEIVQICYQAYSQQIHEMQTQWTFNLLRWMCLYLQLTLSQIYHITRNPGIRQYGMQCSLFFPGMTLVMTVMYWYVIPHAVAKNIAFVCFLNICFNCPNLKLI